MFEGGIDLFDVEKWINPIETLFEFMHLNEREKESCANYILKKDVRIWWDVVKQTRDTTQMIWADFLKEFNNKYYNVYILAAKVTEFSNLKQGNLLVIEYIRKFNRLARYAPDMAATNTARVNHFLEGLKLELARDVDMEREGPISYREVVQRTIQAEQ